jgi:predicted outer membrane repeat protein
VQVLKHYQVVDRLQLVEVAPDTVLDVVKALQGDPAVLYAEPDYTIELMVVPNDTHFDRLWGLRNTGAGGDGMFCYVNGTPGADIRVEQAWDYWRGDPSFRVAVIDTGVDYNHPDLAANIWRNPNEFPGDANGDGCPGTCGIDDDGDGRIDEDSQDRQPGEAGYRGDLNNDDDENGWNDDVHGYDFINRDPDPMDDNSHGTHVSGTIGAVGNNGIGVAGVNWHCKIVALKILDRNGTGRGVSNAVEALEYVTVNGIRVSNNSWGYTGGPSLALYDAIYASQAAGHIFVAAAGNNLLRDNDLIHQYPAAYSLPNVITVAALDNRFDLARFSNFGPTSVDLAAPGACVFSTVLRSDYGYKDGTSMAAPHVTGVTALIMSRYPELDWRRARDRLFYTSRRIPSMRTHSLFEAVVDAAGAVGDCNLNGLPDELDIASGLSPDWGGNNIPDECEPDCNGNGIPDSCDLLHGTSTDCNDNARPDECEPDCNGNMVADTCELLPGGLTNCNQNSVPDVCEIEAGSQAPGGPFFCASPCAADCNDNGIPDTCDIAEGRGTDCTFNGILDECEVDCNRNGRADTCDIAARRSRDCTFNGIPDECEPDCNLNGRADTCDIMVGSSRDCDEDGLPDECESGVEFDCNRNGVEDACELQNRAENDCNANRQLDACDIRDGVSTDQDGNGVPDECDGKGVLVRPVVASGAHLIRDREIILHGGGQRVTLEVRLAGWDLDLDGEPKLWGYQMNVDPDGYASGLYGQLTQARIPCRSNQDCPGRSNCLSDGRCDILSSGYIDVVRSDFVFYDRLAIAAVNPVSLAPGFIFGSLLWNLPDAVHDDGAEKYLGTFHLDVPRLTGGTFTISLTRDGAQLRRGPLDPISVPLVRPALITVIPDCNENGVPDEFDIEDGTSFDCNHNDLPDECIVLEHDCNANGVPDDCDLEVGSSADCNANGVPDECIASENDCNANTFPDSCDLATGISSDCNGNGVPDECASETDCDANGRPDACDVAEGWADDCNSNLRPDSCDIAAGASRDCNGNGVPDECRPPEADCNANGRPDVCDIADRLVPDCNRNGRPDGCDLASGESADVNQDGVPDECRRTLRVPGPEYSTLLKALLDAQPGDLILVADGIYRGRHSRSLSFAGRALTVRSLNGPRRCIIRCDDSGRAFHFINQETSTSRLEGFTVTGGSADFGGAIYCRGSSPVISNCIFVRNNASFQGGAIHCEARSSPIISRCSFIGNAAQHDGGAVYCQTQSNTLINNCLFVGNVAGAGGGAFYFDNLSNTILTHCTVTRNRANLGGGIYCARASLQAPGFSAPLIRNSIFWADSASRGPEIYLARNAQLAVQYSTIEGGPDVAQIIGSAMLHWDEGNIVSDPEFISLRGPDGDSATYEDNDYRLSADSLSVDGGTPDPSAGEIDLDGRPRALCGRPDMGAYEFAGGDHDCDRAVNLSDHTGWPGCVTGPIRPDDGFAAVQCAVFDFDNDKDVDLRDFARFTERFE